MFVFRLRRPAKDKITALLPLIFWCLSSGWAAANDGEGAYERCLQKAILSAPDTMTAGELRSQCLAKTPDEPIAGSDGEKTNGADAVERRLTIDQENVRRPFTIMSHRQNYFLAAAHNFNGYRTGEYADELADEDVSLKDTEVQFQLSLKTPLATNILAKNFDIYAAYTVRSFWQLYRTDISSPFRNTDHEPEFWLQAYPDFKIFGFTNVGSALGMAHQSNGKGGLLSRSWNRIYGNFIFHRGNFAVSIKPWIRIAEESDDDDNPDITDYLGHGELRLAYKYEDHTFSFMSRNNLESGFSKGAVELGWSFPLFDYPYLKGFLQYFSGYGESLIDYNKYVNRIGVGIMLTDLL